MKEIINYKYFLISNIKKDINEKYKGSFFGVLWTFINPLFLTLIYALIFPYILKSRENNYTMFLVIGILTWNYFYRSIINTTKTIVNNRDLLKKIYFPKIILPLTISISELINFLISTIIIFIFLLIFKIGFSVYILYFPLIVAIQFIFMFGISLITSALDVFFRDVEYILDFILKLLYYITPVFYSINLFSESKLIIMLKINPMTTILMSYRNIFLDKVNPNFFNLFLVLLFSLLIFIIGLLIFKKLEKKFVEEL